MSLMDYVKRGCPYCGEPCLLAIDRSIPEQQYIEDCPICCRPIVVSIQAPDPDQPADVTLRTEDE